MKPSLALLIAAAIFIPSQSTFKASGTGAVTRKTSEKLGEVVSVCDYELPCPSATDDTAAVAAALTALPTNGGEVFFPAGTYKFNLSTTRQGLVFRGVGSGHVNVGTGGTTWTAAVAGSPILQLGDGASTAAARGSKVKDVFILGDGLNATGDGIYLFGARDITLENVGISAMGRDGVLIKCNTTSSSGIHLVQTAISGSRRAAIRAEYCASSFTTDITVSDSHINGYNQAGSYAVYLDSAVLWVANSYFDLGGDALGHVAMVKNQATNPGIIASNAAFDNAGGSSAVSLDVSSWIAKNQTLSTAISGTFTLNGQIHYSDATVAATLTRSAAQLQPWLNNPYVFTSLILPLTEAEAQAGGTAVTIARSGVTPDTDADVVVAHAGLKVSAAEGSNGFNNGLHLGTSALYKNQNSLLMWRKDSNRPAAENNAQPINWVSNAPTYGGTVTVDLTLGNIFIITATNGTAFTISNPSGSGTGVSSHGNSMSMVCISNTSGGALGVATWSANYHLAGAWVQPATGNRRCVGFTQDPTGTPWYETWRSAADIAN